MKGSLQFVLVPGVFIEYLTRTVRTSEATRFWQELVDALAMHVGVKMRPLVRREICQKAKNSHARLLGMCKHIAFISNAY